MTASRKYWDEPGTPSSFSVILRHAATMRSSSSDERSCADLRTTGDDTSTLTSCHFLPDSSDVRAAGLTSASAFLDSGLSAAALPDAASGTNGVDTASSLNRPPHTLPIAAV
jgi:hypothetical protein